MPSPVALVGPIPPWRGGIADQTLRLARAMGALGVAPRVFTFSRMYPGFLYPGIRDPKKDFLEGNKEFAPELGDVRAILDGLNPLSFRSASKEIIASGASLVVVPWWTAYFALHVFLLFKEISRRAPDVTKLLLCHNVFDHERSAFKNALTRAVLRRADRFVVQNARSGAEIASERPGAPVALVPHPSEPRAILPDRETARARLGVPAEAPVFLFSGILRPYKGWDVLLDAFVRVREEFPDALLVFAGEPWGDAAKLLHAVNSRPTVKRALSGELRRLLNVRLELRYLSEEERAQWFAAADAVVCPYRHATGSGIAADALAFGRPVIGTRVDGLSDVVDDGVSGLLVPPGDPESLAGAMARFLRERLGPRLSAGAALARSRFSPAEHAKRILSLGGIPV
jgi:D-inositol-3-phosphate glycosyltransferase